MDGVYNMNARQNFTLANNAVIRLSSASKDASKVTLQSSEGRCINFYGTNFASVDALTLIATGAGAGLGAINFEYGSGSVQNCVIKHTGTTGYRFGISVSKGIVHAANNQINGGTVATSSAFLSLNGGVLACYNNTGSNNAVSLTSNHGMILAAGTIPTATTNYSKVLGGVIFKDGAMV